MEYVARISLEHVFCAQPFVSRDCLIIYHSPRSCENYLVHSVPGKLWNFLWPTSSLILLIVPFDERAPQHVLECRQNPSWVLSDCLLIGYCFQSGVESLHLHINWWNETKYWYTFLVVLALWHWWINCNIVFPFLFLESAMFIATTRLDYTYIEQCTLYYIHNVLALKMFKYFSHFLAEYILNYF